MTLIRPYLLLRRLTITSKTGKIAYDEYFHKGVNIIRGKNSSGKSTIANFIFYVLGGDFHNWTSVAIQCDDVFAEVELNAATITIKRKITEHGGQPMSIFWGDYETAIKTNIGWQQYPYKQSENLVSFTNVLFNALSFPEVKSDLDSNITMHQVLRLLYIDQDTPTQNLFRYERFDLPLTRQAIAELLLGIYDDSLYYERLAFRNSQREYDEKKRQLDGISRIFGTAGSATSLSGIQNEVGKTSNDLNEIDRSINALRNEQQARRTNRTPLIGEKIQQELIPLKNQIATVKSSIEQYGVDIFDSKQFVQTLEKRVSELNNSMVTRKVLGELPLTHCPQCLSPLENHVEDGHCFLCKQKLDDGGEKTQAIRLLQEMELQIKESKGLLEEKEHELAKLTGELPILIQKSRTLQKQLDSSITNPQTTRDESIDLLLVQKGGLEQKLAYLAEQTKAVERLEQLRKDLEDLAAASERLRSSIAQKENIQRERFERAMGEIKNYTLHILRNDLDRQAEFTTGKLVEINFPKDSYSLDGNNNFSASSKIYFKNAILFSIFFASVEVDFFRYPRFILCDNMEDKGMEKERTQNFQKLIASLSEQQKKDHQIIFTTSMIADELNNTPLCVGEYYDQNNKTLKL